MALRRDAFLDMAILHEPARNSMTSKRYYGVDTPRSTGPHPDPMGIERLKSVAILRSEEVLERGFKSHYQLRLAIDPDDPDPRMPKLGDIDGFVTTTDRFVDRDEAKEVAIAAGQIHPSWKSATRKLLSSDVNW
jgi:hypothetical protein